MQEENKIHNKNTHAITFMLLPQKAKNVSMVLGMIAWFSKLIPRIYTNTYISLYRKIINFVWSAEAQKYFDLLKKPLVHSLVPAQPNYSLHLEHFSDGSSVEKDRYSFR